MRRVARTLASRLPSSLRVDDLAQEGLIAVLLALRRGGSELSPAYVTIRSRGAMLDYVRRQYPRAVGDRIKAIGRAADALPGAGAAELAEAAGITEEQYHDALVAWGRYRDMEVTAHQYHDDIDPGTLAGEPLAALVAASETDRLERAIAALPERQRYVIRQTFGEGRGLAEVGRDLGIGESRASQIRGEAVRAIRRRLSTPPPWNRIKP